MTTLPASARALLPLLLFLALFLGSGVYYSMLGTEFAFYQLKAPIAALPAIVLAVVLHKAGINRAIDQLLAGMGHANIMLMVLVFLLAGAFATVSEDIGSVEATVQFALQWVPANAVLPALFVIAGFIATAMGTSMGTIAATAPIAVGFAAATGLSPALALGAVVSGAMFGDNLSMISDTTIAATRSQGVSLKDKFRVNVWITLPAALLTIIVLFMLGGDTHQPVPQPSTVALILPYLAVFALAFSGLHVLAVLTLGLLLSGALGLLLTPDYALPSFSAGIYRGFEGMFEISLLALLMGGLSALMQAQGGSQWLLQQVERLTQRLALARRSAGELGIVLLVSTANLFVANNTVAIVLSGDLARHIALKYGVEPRRAASHLDIFSCVVQGLIPYGAQVLLASSMAKLSPISLISQVYYCWILGLMALFAVLLNWPKLQSSAPSAAHSDDSLL